MEPLESALMDELLRDFSGDLLPPTPPSQRRRRAPGGTGAAPQAPPRPEEEHRLRSPVPAATPIMHPSLLDGPAVGSALEPFPAFVEEDLEWLSNKDAFPTLDTFDISACREPSPPPPPPAANPKRPSPVSVLDGVALPVAAPVPPSLKWATGRARSKGRRRRKRPLQVFHPRPEAPPAREKRRCWHCEAEDTPQWRAGPHGPKTLCNACGVRYKSGRLLPEYRPASSPTFSSNLHSNSHRKVMEMRRKKEVGLHPASAAPATMTKKKGLLAV